MGIFTKKNKDKDAVLVDAAFAEQAAAAAHVVEGFAGDDFMIDAAEDAGDSAETLLRKLVVGDADMTDGTYYYMKQGMEGMVEAIKEDYDNSKMAIGYSVYYYVDAMMGTGGLKFLKVDGVEPTNEAIASGEYPLVNDFYAVIRKDSPQSAVEVRDWLLSAEGQAFVQECGYVPVQNNQ